MKKLIVSIFSLTLLACVCTVSTWAAEPAFLSEETTIKESIKDIQSNPPANLPESTTHAISYDVLNNVVFVAAGEQHSAAITADSALYVWGSGLLGNGEKSTISKPIKVLDNVVYVSAGDRYTAAVKSDGSLWTWGDNYAGQLGTGSTAESAKPMQILTDVATISTGHHHAAALKKDGTVWTFGTNSNGELGNSTITQENALAPIQVMTNVKAVSCGYDYTAAIKEDGSLWVWGANYYGFPNAAYDDVAMPTPMKIMDDVSYVSCGSDHMAVIKTDSSLWIWGDNNSGLIGNGEIGGYVKLPVKIMENVSMVAAGGEQTIAMKTDGTIWGWGRLGKGQAAGKYYNTTVSGEQVRHTPMQIMSDASYIATGYAHSFAILKNGTLWAWGYNAQGQLGDPNIKDSTYTYYFYGNQKQYIENIQTEPVQIGNQTSSELSDVNQSHNSPSTWANSGVSAANEAGLIPELTGSPDFQDVITREQFAELAVQMITVLCGEGPDISNAAIFTDCNNASVSAAAAAGIVSGIGEGKFNPKATTNREQIATMIARTIAYIDNETGSDLAPVAADISKFSDKDQISPWAVDGVGMLAANGIMAGTSATTLSPKASCTVEQSILLLYRVYEQFHAAN